MDGCIFGNHSWDESKTFYSETAIIRFCQVCGTKEVIPIRPSPAHA